MRIFQIAVLLLGLAINVSAGPYYSLKLSTASGTADYKLSGDMCIAASSLTPNTCTITLDGTTGLVEGFDLPDTFAEIAVATAASAVVAGTDGQIQFNNLGSFGADANLFWDNTNKLLGVGIAVPGSSVSAVSIQWGFGIFISSGLKSGAIKLESSAADDLHILSPDPTIFLEDKDNADARFQAQGGVLSMGPTAAAERVQINLITGHMKINTQAESPPANAQFKVESDGSEFVVLYTSNNNITNLFGVKGNGEILLAGSTYTMPADRPTVDGQQLTGTIAGVLTWANASPVNSTATLLSSEFTFTNTEWASIAGTTLTLTMGGGSAVFSYNCNGFNGSNGQFTGLNVLVNGLFVDGAGAGSVGDASGGFVAQKQQGAGSAENFYWSHDTIQTFSGVTNFVLLGRVSGGTGTQNPGGAYVCQFHVEEH